MAITIRQGNEADFNGALLQKGEFALSNDESKLRIRTNDNTIRTVLFREDWDAPYEWKGIPTVIREGRGRQLYPVGTELKTQKSTGDIIWKVLGHYRRAEAMANNYIYPTNPNLDHFMVLGMKYAYGTDSAVQTIQFDAKEAMYDCDTQLSAGTYHFTSIAYGGWAAGTWQFILTQNVPQGGYLMINNYQDTALGSCKVQSYNASGTLIEQVQITSGSGGANLGTWGTDMNHPHRISYGSNNYAQSGIRQFLNNDANKWTKQAKWDTKPSWLGNSADILKGFKFGMDEQFIDAVQGATLPCMTNNVFETNSLDGSVFTTNSMYTLEDEKFWLMSRPEVLGSWSDNNRKDGRQFEHYIGKTATELTTYDKFGTERYQWLRSPDVTNATSGGIVYHGAWYSNGAINSHGLFAACIIA